MDLPKGFDLRKMIWYFSFPFWDLHLGCFIDHLREWPWLTWSNKHFYLFKLILISWYAYLEQVRLQLEALLAEKSRLANENANLVRENQCLHQLVEYHQIASQDLSASYEEVLRGVCLDFSSPVPEESIDEEDEDIDVADSRDTRTPSTDVSHLFTSLDNCFDKEQ